MKKILFPALFLTLALSGTVYAHQPRIVEAGAVTNIEKPEVSQAFYASLNGKPQAYFINATEPFKFYAGLLVPDVPGATQDFSAEILQIGKYIDADGHDAAIGDAAVFGGKKNTLFNLDGTQTKWERFHEEFGDDWYWQGPETAPMDSENAPLPAGLYEIKVSNPGNQGKYVLVVGTLEQFPPREIWNTLFAMPRVKTFFGASPLTAFLNRIGLFIFGPILGLIALGLGGWILLRRNAKRKQGLAGLWHRLLGVLTKRRFRRE